MTVIGVTGNIGSGKTTFSRLLEQEKGCLRLDADYLGRLVAEPDGEAYGELRQTFGEDYFLADGRLNRPKMAELVFNNPSELAKLNGIMHPAVLRQIQKEIAAAKAENPQQIVVVEAALLIEADYLGILDELWLVWADDEVRLARVMSRDGATAEQAQARMRNQMPQAEKTKYASRIVHNNSDINDLRSELETVWQKFVGR